MSIWQKDFWKAAVERMVRGAAIGAGTIVGGDVFNAFEADWERIGGAAAGGAFLSLLFSLIGNAASGNGPSFTSTEQVATGYGTSLAEREAGEK
jgi:hypothetical protein